MLPLVHVRRSSGLLARSARLALATTLATTLTLHAGAARADEADDRHAEGTALSKKGEFEAARIKLLQALNQRAMPKTMLNLCVVEQQLKLDEEAIKHCRQFLAAKGADPATVKTVQDGLLRELEQVTGRVTIVAPAGAKVEVDGHPVGVAPFSAPVDLKVGERTCSAGGRSVRILVRPGEAVTASLVAEDTPASPPSPPPAPGARTERGSWLVPGVLAGVGLVGLGVGGGLALAATGKASSLQAATTTRAGSCGETGADCQDLQSTYSSGKGLRTGSYIAYGVGGAALLGAVIVAVIQAPWKERTLEGASARVGPRRLAMPELVPWVGPTSGLMISGVY